MPKAEKVANEFHAGLRLVREFRPYKGRIALIVLLGWTISAIQPISVKISQQIIDELKAGMRPDFFRWVPLALVGIFLVSGFAKYGYNTIRRILCETVILKLRSSVFQKYLSLPLSVIDKRRTGEMLSGMQNDLQQIQSGVDTLCDLLKEPFTFLGLIGAAFYFDWRLASMTLVAAPLVAQLFGRTGAAVKRYSSRNMAQFSDLISVGQESLVGARVVKVFRLEDPLRQKFENIQAQYLKTLTKSIRVQELAVPSVELVGAVLMAMVIVYGGYRTAHGELTAGQLIAFVIALGLAQMPLKQLNNAWLKLKTAEAAAERVYGLLDTPDSSTARPSGSRQVEGLHDRIEYQNVSLAYGEKAVLQNICFEVKRGECLALVGQSGSGKTSIVNLLPRLYEISEGSILIDGVDIRDIRVESLRDLMSFVTQDVFLFHDTIFENIRYGNPRASEEEVRRAAEQAHCTDFIGRFSHGFDTVVGDRGMTLSGGERQRIAIARAFVKGAPILVLDEATSSLDSHSEKMVQSALDELMKGKTTFLVAHRFSTVLRANRILVLENGRIVEGGTHQELLGLNGIYHNLYQHQTVLRETVT